jgi:glycyl-tRNA synthetase beta subunit
VAGCFAAALAPVAENDPFDLRRQGLGIIRILAEANYRLAVPQLVEDALGLLPHALAPAAETAAVVLQFLREMYLTALAMEGIAPAVSAAVLAVTEDCPADALQRARVITRHLGDANFAVLLHVANRFSGLARQEGEAEGPQSPAAHDLQVHARELAPRAEFFAARGEFAELPALFIELFPDIDRFFAEPTDAEHRHARPALARNLLRLFRLLGDLTVLQ